MKSGSDLNYLNFFKPDEFKVSTIWKFYEVAVIPKDAPQIQRDQTRRAFYAGFLECFKIMTDYAGELPEDSACALFNRLAEEADAFFEEMVTVHGKPGDIKI